MTKVSIGASQTVSLSIICFFLFVCLYGVLRPTRETFTNMETSPLPSYFDLSSAHIATQPGGFFRVHTYCDTGHPFIMVISEDPCQSQLFQSAQQSTRHFLLLQLPVCRGWYSNIQTSACETNLVHQRGGMFSLLYNVAVQYMIAPQKYT